MKSKPFGVLFGLLALVAILGVAPAFGQTANQISITAGAGSSANAACVTAKNCFAPNPLTVAPGVAVTWTNTDTASHTVTSGKVTDNDAGSLFDSGLIKPGKTFQFTFANAGTFNFFCTVHPWMAGQVIVGAASSMATGQNAMGNQSGIPLGAPYTAGNAVPEFGPVASIVLAIAILSVVVFAAKTRVIPRL
jgi:predicted secreted protein with PEFG-CTERM motif